jgi:hypothetical protein
LYPSAPGTPASSPGFVSSHYTEVKIDAISPDFIEDPRKFAQLIASITEAK